MGASSTITATKQWQQKKRGGKLVFTADGVPVYRVRVWDPTLKKQVEKTAYGEDEAKAIWHSYEVAKAAPVKQRLQSERITLATLAREFTVAYATKIDGSVRPHSSWNKVATILDSQVIRKPLGKRYLDDVTTKEMDDAVREMVKRNGEPLAPASRQTVALVLIAMFKWAKYVGKTPAHLGLGMHTSWGTVLTHRTLIPSLPQVFRLADALDYFSPGLGDSAIVMALVGLRWEELCGMSRDQVDLVKFEMVVDRICTEAGGKRELRMLRGKSAAAMRTVVIPDLAVPAIRRLLEADRHAFDTTCPPAPMRHLRQSEWSYLASPEYYEWYLNAPWARLVNNSKGGFASYGNWRKVLTKAQARTSTHPDGPVPYTAHQLRHVAASLLISSGAEDYEVQNQFGHRKVETTRNIYQHLFEADRSVLRGKLNARATALYVVEDAG